MRVCWVLDLFSLQVFTFGGKLIYVGGTRKKTKTIEMTNSIANGVLSCQDEFTHTIVTGKEKAHGPTGTRTSHIPSKHSDHWDTEPHGRPMTICSCLIRFVLESARNHAGTNETVPMLLAAMPKPMRQSLCCSQPCRNQWDSPYAARSPSTDPHWPPNVTGEEIAQGPTGTRTQDLSHTVRALWPQNYQATRSTCGNINLCHSANMLKLLRSHLQNSITRKTVRAFCMWFVYNIWLLSEHMLFDGGAASF